MLPNLRRGGALEQAVAVLSSNVLKYSIGAGRVCFLCSKCACPCAACFWPCKSFSFDWTRTGGAFFLALVLHTYTLSCDAPSTPRSHLALVQTHASPESQYFKSVILSHYCSSGCECSLPPRLQGSRSSYSSVV